MAAGGPKLLWGTANLFTHRRFMSGAATNPDPDIFAYSAATVITCMDATHKLGGEYYVQWGGREGYETLLNTDLRAERDHAGRFLLMEVEYKQIFKNIGMGTTVWSPLASGVLTDKYLKEFPKDTRLGMDGLEWLKDRSLTPASLEVTRKLNALALKLETSLPKLAIAWALKDPNVTSAILGASKVHHLEETLDAVNLLPSISDEVMENIETILGNKPAQPMF